MKTSTPRKLRERLNPILHKVASPLFVLLFWELMVRVGLLDHRFFPAPSTIAGTLAELTLSGELWMHVSASLQRVTLGFLIGGILGLVIGLAMGWSRLAEGIIDPLIAVFYPLPKLALLPLLLIIFGIGEASKVAIVAIAVFFTVVINAAAGVRNIEPVLIDAARNYGARGPQMFLKVVIPAALPTIFTGLRLGMGLGLVVIIAAEFVASQQGLGYLVWLSWGTLSTAKMYTGLIVIGLIGLLSTYALQWVAAFLMPWNIAGDRERGVRSEWRRRAEGLRLFPRLGSLLETFVSYSRHYLYAIRDDHSLNPPPPMENGARFEWIDYDNLNLLRPWKGRRAIHRFRRNLNRGMLGLFALEGERVVGYVWGTLKTDQTARGCSHLPITTGQAFTQSVEVNPEYRRRGIATHLRYTLLHRVREMGHSAGVNEFVGLVRVENTPMQKLIERQGSARDKEVARLKLTPWIFSYWVWELDAEGNRARGRPRWMLRFKIPDLVFDPLVLRLSGLHQAIAVDGVPPKGEG
jgi:ABC-type nitrate/sulfonate/bicarbonate transport system permease component/ribosomal protein S18 acetylase RimI-like enzyme